MPEKENLNAVHGVDTEMENEKEFRLKITLENEREYSRHLKRMVIFFSTALGYTLGALIGIMAILCITKI